MIKYRGSTETNHDNYTMPRIQLFVEPSLLPFSASHVTWFYVHTLAILSCPNIMGPGLCARGTQPMCNYKYFISPQGMSSHSLPIGRTFFYPAFSIAGNFLSLLMPRFLLLSHWAWRQLFSTCMVDIMGRYVLNRENPNSI